MIYQPAENTGEYTTGVVYSEKYVKGLEQEVERLNNIINELEKYLNYEYKHIRKNINFKEVLNKLQELKGEDKE